MSPSFFQFLSGKPLSRNRNKRQASKNEQAQQLLQQYEEILTFLKGYGALLTQVEARYLIGLNNYIRILNAQRESSPDPLDSEKRGAQEVRSSLGILVSGSGSL